MRRFVLGSSAFVTAAVVRSGIVQIEAKQQGNPTTRPPFQSNLRLPRPVPLAECNFDRDTQKNPPSNLHLEEMSAKFPEAPIKDLNRFLVARHGDVHAASRMYENAIAWRSSHLPANPEDLARVFEQASIFPHGRAKDGTMVLYFRWGLHDPSKISSEQFVAAVAHTLDYVLQTDKNNEKVTVFVHLACIPGAINGAADVNFIRHVIQVITSLHFTSHTILFHTVLLFL